MRVLFLSDARRIGGSEVYLREMLPRVKALGLSPEAALPEAEGTLPVRRALEAAGIPVHAYRDLEALPEAVDLVVASAWYPQSYRRFFARYPRLVLLVHDQIEVFYPWGAVPLPLGLPPPPGAQPQAGAGRPHRLPLGGPVA